MKKYVCSVCGYVHTAESLDPDFKCPVCKVPASKFVEQKGEQKLAAVHEYGVYAQTVKNNPDISAEDKKYIFDQLMANFNGECSEVGMYLCMARIAHREGYPAWRVDCEFGATQGKFDLASCAKKNGLDAIHDTVHEMARDEARHGVALKGLLERYFK